MAREAPNRFRHKDQIIEDWSEELAARFGCTAQDIKEQPTRLIDCSPNRIRIELMDGSNVEFRCAFALVNESQHAIAVFSEHCGYHVFPCYEAKLFRDDVLVYEHDPWKQGDSGKTPKG